MSKTAEEIGNEILNWIPKGYEFVRIGKFYPGDYYLNGILQIGGPVALTSVSEHFIILKRKMVKKYKRTIITCLDREPFPGEYYTYKSMKEFDPRYVWKRSNDPYIDNRHFKTVEIKHEYEDVPEPIE
jgi:hypothetical protein